MKYYYEKPKEWLGAGKVIECGHPMFRRATLFEENGKGLLIVQERFNEKTGTRRWDCIEPWLAGDIYLNENYAKFFENNAKIPDQHDLYPVFSLRKVMWALRMKPLKKEPWEEWEGQPLN